MSYSRCANSSLLLLHPIDIFSWARAPPLTEARGGRLLSLLLGNLPRTGALTLLAAPRQRRKSILRFWPPETAYRGVPAIAFLIQSMLLDSPPWLLSRESITSNHSALKK